MSDGLLPLSIVNTILEMGYTRSVIELAYQATKSHDLNILLEWILAHENETNHEYQTIQQVIELGYSKSSVELAQRETRSNDVQTLVNWILDHNPSEVSTSKQERSIKTNDTLASDLIRLGFHRNDIDSCVTELTIDPPKKSKATTKLAKCMDWLINNNQKKAELKANKIKHSQSQLRIPPPIVLNKIQATNSCSTTPTVITNGFLKEVHLSSRHQATTNYEQEPSLTPEEAIMVSIHENLKQQTWTIYNIDQLHLIQKYIKIVARVIDEDRRNTQQHNDDRKTKIIEPAAAKSTKKNVFTLADLNNNSQIGYIPHLARPPPNFFIPGALEPANWDPNSLDEVDRIAMQLNYISGENYRRFADRLIQECHVSSNDQSSITRAIFVWITNHIRYDIQFSTRDNSFVRNEEQMDGLCQLILNTGSCVCVGYAVLFKRMCEYFNIRVDYVTGYTKLTKSCINDTAGNDVSDRLSGHAWTMAYVDGKTYFADPTWSAASWSSSGRIESPASNTYYLIPPMHSIYQFRPHQDCDQHLDVPWNIERFTQEPCFYPYFFRLNLTLENRDTQWYYYRLTVNRSQQTSLTKAFRVITRECQTDARFRLQLLGYMYWSRELNILAEDLSSLRDTPYEHRLDEVQFERIDLRHANNRLNGGNMLYVAALENIPIYPPNLDVNQIQYGLFRAHATDQLSGLYKPIFECIFEFQ